MPSRSRFVAVALFGIAGLAAVLAAEAYLTSRYHLTSAERVLSDYAALGAEGAGNRLEAGLAGRLYPILAALGERSTTSRPTLEAALGSRARPMVAAVAWAARIDSAGRVTPVVAGVPGWPADLVARIRTAGAHLPESAYFGSGFVADQFMVFAPLRPGRGGAVFALPVKFLTALAESLLADDPLLPRSLRKGASLDSGLAVRLLDGERTIAARGRPDPGGFRAVAELSSLFGGLAIEVTVARALAPRLIIGGLPRSRLPLLLGVLGLAVALAVAGVAQLRQERALLMLREDFVAGASHELRTPLAQIRLFAETLRLGRVRSPEEGDRSLAVIEREARRLEHLVENMLHFSRAERASLRVTPERVDLSRLTQEVVADFEPLAAKGEVKLAVQAGSGITGSVDLSAFRQILVNLLDNAVKYGGRGTTVSIRLERTDRGYDLSVTDQGPGVGASERERVWERFWRGESARQATIAGTGIGLATVRDLVTLHGGNCWVEPVESRGSRFVARFPLG